MQTRTTHILAAEPTAVTAAAPVSCRVSVVIPCLDEAETIVECVARAQGVLEESGLAGEVIDPESAPLHEPLLESAVP